MVDQELVESEPASSLPAIHSVRGTVSIPDAAPVRLQTLDLARHVAIAPDEKRYVVATFDDHRVGNGFVTAIYPQQNDYLTLIQLVVYQVSSEMLEEAVQKHIDLVKTIQQGQLNNFLKTHKK